jgi:tripartite-type tricarboxylate transporter receptor subunit TctC
LINQGEIAMNPFKQLAVAAFALMAAVGSGNAGAQGKFPARPVHIIVSVSPGSQADLLARIMASRMFEGSGQPVIVENRPGSAGVPAAQAVTSAAPDGYTLLVAPASFAVSVVLYPKLLHDIRKELTGVSRISSGANVLIVNKSLGVHNVQELVALAKSKPGVLNYGSSGLGSSGQINGEMLRMGTGIDITHIMYKGAPEAITDLLANRIQLFFSSIAAAISYIKDGRVVALGVTTRERSAQLPDVPTLQEAGVPGYEYDQWFALLAPAKTPKPVLERLSHEVARVLALPDVKDRMMALGAVPRSSTPEQENANLSAEIRKYTKIVHDAGIKVQQ